MKRKPLERTLNTTKKRSHGMQYNNHILVIIMIATLDDSQRRQGDHA